MKLSLLVKELKNYLERQLYNFYPDAMTEKYFKGEVVERAVRQGLE